MAYSLAKVCDGQGVSGMNGAVKCIFLHAGAIYAGSLTGNLWLYSGGVWVPQAITVNITGASAAGPTASWTQQYLSVGGSIYCVVSGSTAGGVGRIWKLTGTAWANLGFDPIALGSIFDQMVTVACIHGGELYFMGSDGVFSETVYKWNGAAFSIVANWTQGGGNYYQPWTLFSFGGNLFCIDNGWTLRRVTGGLTVLFDVWPAISGYGQMTYAPCECWFVDGGLFYWIFPDSVAGGNFAPMYSWDGVAGAFTALNGLSSTLWAGPWAANIGADYFKSGNGTVGGGQKRIALVDAAGATTVADVAAAQWRQGLTLGAAIYTLDCNTSDLYALSEPAESAGGVMMPHFIPGF